MANLQDNKHRTRPAFSEKQRLRRAAGCTIGVPVYMCGGGTIPLLQQWLADGMSMASAAAFMITGPATKFTNLGAVKIVLGWKRFLLYIAFCMAFAWCTGMIADIMI